MTQRTQNDLRKILRLKSELGNADAVLIGAGAGLSASAGFTYSGERFREYFSDFEEKYGFRDMYAGGFYPYASPEEFWAYWSRYIFVNRYCDPPKPVYGELYKLVKGKEYFVLTTNVDHCFQKAGFGKERLFYTQGDYGLFQCSEPCGDRTYDNEETVRRMVREQRDLKISSSLIPRCPVCGKPMTTNLRSDDKFVEDDGWRAAHMRYNAFLQKFGEKRLLLLELGVGGNTPGIIKYPFRRMAMQNPRATYVCVNAGEAYCPAQIRNSVCIDADVGDTLTALLK